MASRTPAPLIAPIFLAVFSLGVLGTDRSAAADLASLAQQPLGQGEEFKPVSEAALNTAAAKLRSTLGSLESLLARSPSGAEWKRYLEWPALSAQAEGGKAADPAVLHDVDPVGQFEHLIKAMRHKDEGRA